MHDRSSERLGAATGLIAAAAVAAPVLVDLAAGDGEIIDGARWLWWAAFAVFVATLAVDGLRARGRSSQTSTRLLLAIEIAAAATVYLVDPSYEWVAVLFVVTAASGAYTLQPRQSAFQVAAQSLLIGVGQLASGGQGDVFLAVAVYGSFQAFAVLVVHGEQRETAARTELAASNVELRAASALLSQSTQTAERLRIARELHDVVGHQLTALSLELEVASHHVTGDGLVHVMRARDAAKALLENVRDAVGDLRAPSAQLVEPLQELVDDVPGPAISLEVVEGVEVGDEQAVAIVRCVQEIVTNTLRHADADRLWISVHTGPDGTTVTARDDGRGAIDVRPGHGLTGMRERVEALGGELSVDGGPGCGFQVTARLPPSGTGPA